VLLAYVATAFVVHVPWLQVASATLIPHLSLSQEYLTTLVAIFGTTISPYLFVWQTSEEIEEQLLNPRTKPLVRAPEQAAFQLKRIGIDTCVGMGFSNLISFFLLLTAAVAFHLHGVTHIETSAQAAQALRPVAGEFAFAIFSIGIVAAGLLAVPVLAGSSAYAMAGAFAWENSLEHAPKCAKAFYSVIAISTMAGTAACFTDIDPFKALYWSAVINGVIAVPIMTVMMLMAGRQEIMGQFVIGRLLKTLGWLATAMMALAAIFMLATMGSSQ
ncbi:MAG: divalent metal cation transporter, partial [Burkholderiaceae bacterium]|nr:divalent metal cation transporter [Burkholderiaceae bacterium]